MTPEAKTLLDAIIAANGYESKADDPQRPLINELLAAKGIRIVTSGLTLFVKPARVTIAVSPARGKTTDSATPTIQPIGSTSGLIPPKVTDDPRITKDRG